MKNFPDSSDHEHVLHVAKGSVVNLTCSIHTQEIDWYFKDINSTTNVISYGLQLLSVKPIRQNNDVEKRNSPVVLYKYRVSSDNHSHHMLTVYIQGKDDEGVYQCIDSKSDMPIKKTIRVALCKKIILKILSLNL